MSSTAAMKASRAGARRAARERGQRLPPAARVLLVTLCAGIAMFFIVRLAALPLLTIRQVEVGGEAPVTRQEALALAGLRGTEYWMTVPVDAIRRRLETHPLVRRAAVRTMFPSTLLLTLEARKPAALVLAEEGGRTVALLADEAAFLYKAGAAGPEMDLPVLAGLAAGEAVVGRGLPRAYAGVCADLRALADSSPRLAALLSEVRVLPSSGAEPDLVLYLTSAALPVRARRPVDASLLRSALMVIDLLSKQGILRDIQELDFRSGQVVYRMKEG